MGRGKLFEVYVYYILLYIMFIISTYISKELIGGSAAIVVSIIWMIMSATLYFLAIRKSHNNYVVLIYAALNAVIGGIAASAYYSIKTVTPYSPIYLVLFLAALMLVNYGIMCIINNKRNFAIINLVFTVLLLIFLCIKWIKGDLSLGSSLVFLCVIYLCFSIALYLVIMINQEWFNIIPLASLLMFGGILLVVLIVITEGEVLDGIEIDLSTGSKKKSRF